MISSHTGFQPLKEVWLGDCYPAEWYCDFDNQAQDLFGYITELTKQDLKKFEQKLQELSIIVHRPVFDNKSKFVDNEGNLIKPPITPRDWAMTLGDTLYIIPQYQNSFTGFEVNMLVVDESNIFCIAENDHACQQLERMGITPHIIDFRCRGFWDGGLHCLTTDIHREGPCSDYWLGRGPTGIYR
jgi:hypothetical protein